MLTALKGLNSSVERRNGLNSWNLYRQVGRDLRSVHSHTHWGMWAGWSWQQQQVKFTLIVSSGPTSLNKVMRDWKGSGCYSIWPSPLLSLWGSVSNSQPRRCASRSTPWHTWFLHSWRLEYEDDELGNMSVSVGRLVWHWVAIKSLLCSDFMGEEGVQKGKVWKRIWRWQNFLVFVIW